MPRSRSSSREATPITSPDSRRFRAPSTVPWIAKFQTSAMGAPDAEVILSATSSGSSAFARRLLVTPGTLTLVAATRASTAAAAARSIVATTVSTRVPRTVASRLSSAIQPIRRDSTKAPGPECVWLAETRTVAGPIPCSRRRSTARVKARSTAIRSTLTHARRADGVSSTSARAATESSSPAWGLNQNAWGCRPRRSGNRRRRRTLPYPASGVPSGMLKAPVAAPALSVAAAAGRAGARVSAARKARATAPRLTSPHTGR